MKFVTEEGVNALFMTDSMRALLPGLRRGITRTVPLGRLATAHAMLAFSPRTSSGKAGHLFADRKGVLLDVESTFYSLCCSGM